MAVYMDLLIHHLTGQPIEQPTHRLADQPTGECANGLYPDVAVKTMARIVENAELGVDYDVVFKSIRLANGCDSNYEF